MKESCSLCLKEVADIRDIIYIRKPNIGICQRCIRVMDILMGKAKDEGYTSGNIIDQETLTAEWEELMGRKVIDDDNIDFNLTPTQIHAKLDKQIIGQKQAKKVLSVAVYNHIKRINGGGQIKKSNILMVGPTGSGKTLLAQTLANIINVPFAIADATTLTQTGYRGDDVESILTRLLSATNNDVHKAERGIIFIDEIDKIAKRSIIDHGSGADGIGVQQDLLKLIEGSVVDVPVSGFQRSTSVRSVKIDTSNILFICGGAFEDFYKQRNNKEEKHLGFVKEVEKEELEEVNLSTETLTKCGLMPELLGRLPILVQLEELNKSDLMEILTDVDYSILEEYKDLFLEDGVKLIFEEEAIEAIADKAIERKTGARGLRAIIEEFMLDIMYEMPEQPNISECIITADTVRDGKPKLIFSKNVESEKDL